MQKLGQPIQERYLEAEERPKAFDEMGKQIQQYMKFVEAFKMNVRLRNFKRRSRVCFFSTTLNKISWYLKRTAPNSLFDTFHSFYFQEEQYNHLDEADVSKVDKLTSDAMIWMNSTMNQQSKQSLTLDPAVKVKDIRAKTRVSVYTNLPVSN